MYKYISKYPNDDTNAQTNQETQRNNFNLSGSDGIAVKCCSSCSTVTIYVFCFIGETVKCLQADDEELRHRVMRVEYQNRLLLEEISRRDYETIPRHIKGTNIQHISCPLLSKLIGHLPLNVRLINQN